MSPSSRRILHALILPVLCLVLGIADAAVAEKGGNGNGNNGNGNGNGGSSNSNAGNNGNRGNSSRPARESAPRANVAATNASASSMPQRLNAYKAAYLAAASATSEAQKYQRQYETVAAMTEAEFATAYPGASYQGTLDHLLKLAQENLALAARAESDAATQLARVTANRPLTQQGLAELHQMLGL